MSPETRPGRKYPETIGIQADSLNFGNIFYNALAKMGRSVTLEPFKPDADITVTEPLDLLTVKFGNQREAKRSQEDYDRVYSHSIGALARAGSSEILLLLTGNEDAFYKRYPMVKERTPLDTGILERCFLKDYEDFLRYQQREIERGFRNVVGFPTLKEIKKYRELKRRGISPITPEELQSLVISVIKS